MNKEAAERIRAVLGMGGWFDIKEMFDQAIKEREEDLLHLMDTKTESLTGKVALKYAAGRKAIKDLLEQILDSQQILAPQSKRTGE